jgi:hypothetical protein
LVDTFCQSTSDAEIFGLMARNALHEEIALLDFLEVGQVSPFHLLHCLQSLSTFYILDVVRSIKTFLR